MADETHVYKVRGSHRDERRIRALLGFDPDIHSGMAGKGAFCVRLSNAHRDFLIAEGLKINKKPIR